MDFIQASDVVFNEYAASVEKHGDWSDYNVYQMLAVIAQELAEVSAAVVVNDLHGEHGVIRELAQVSACCHKAIMVLSKREQKEGV